ncbi:MAG: YraN family protein, partial [Bdellovibrionales bacterium]
IDIIAQRGKLFVFCEVKYRPSYDAGLFSISLESQRRIARAGTLFLAKNGRGQDVNMRFDVVIISPPFYMKHLKNAWTL